MTTARVAPSPPYARTGPPSARIREEEHMALLSALEALAVSGIWWIF
ncbi:hypothetical protein J0910_09835 [Nocardiopsis sp. CNT-189]